MAGVGRCHRRVSGRCTRPGSQPCPTPSWALDSVHLFLFEWRAGVILRDRPPADVLPEPDGSVAQLLELHNGVADDWSRHEVELARPDANGTEVHAAGPAIARSRVLSNSCSCPSKSRTAELRAVGPSIRRRSSARCRTRRMAWSPDHPHRAGLARRARARPDARPRRGSTPPSQVHTRHQRVSQLRLRRDQPGRRRDGEQRALASNQRGVIINTASIAGFEG